jgi:hypothetical protein
MPSPGYGSNGSVISGTSNTPTADAASGVWSLGEVAEAERDSIWPAPPVSSYEYITGVTGDGSTANYSFTSLPTTYKTLRIVIQARDTSTQYRPIIRVNNNGTSYYRVAQMIATNANYSASAQTGLSGVYMGIVPINNHPYTACIDFPAYTSTNIVSPVLLWIGQSDQTTGTNASPLTIQQGGLFDGVAATTQINLVEASGYNLSTGSTITLFGLAA